MTKKSEVPPASVISKGVRIPMFEVQSALIAYMRTHYKKELKGAYEFGLHVNDSDGQPVSPVPTDVTLQWLCPLESPPEAE